jgi:hypothetical protein
MVNVIVAPAASVPTLQTTVLPTRAHPLEADLNVEDAGRTSLKLTLVASSGPLLVIVIVYVPTCPATDVVGPLPLTDTAVA